MSELNLLETHREIEKSLRVPVMIPWDEALKITVRDLISKRNSPNNKVRDHFDAVLRYYLDEDEFQRYVIDGEAVA